jgi:hypothetical protein
VQHFEKSNGESPVYRHPLAKEGFRGKTADGLETIQEFLNFSLSKNKGRKFLYSRNSAGTFEGKTYEECFHIARSLGSGIE